MKLFAGLLALILTCLTPTAGGYNLASRDTGAVASGEAGQGGPDKDPFHESNYKKETRIGPVSVEFLIALLFVALLASVPLVLVSFVGVGKDLTRAHIAESCCLVAWLVTALVLFTNFLYFNSGSGHWEGARHLTLVEAVYFLSQILTTVGYGDITPAYPVSQVFVAINVIFALCLYGSIIMEVADLMTHAIQEHLGIEDETCGGSPRDPSSPGRRVSTLSSVGTDEGSARLKDWQHLRVHHVDLLDNLLRFVFTFLLLVCIGVLFWHYYPGEEKTWLQAVYMSVITLSTVGFGAFTATTPGGMVFGAFWMLFGVAALGGVITSFVQIMLQVKAFERENTDMVKLDFYKYVKECSREVKALGDQGMDEYDFTKFAALLQGLVTPEEIHTIEARWNELNPNGDLTISREAFVHAEGPPEFVDDH